MNLLNRYFAPFAALMILFACYFGEADPRTRILAGGVWTTSLIVNWWLAANAYRFFTWTPWLKSLQIWLNFIWAVPLFYLLQGLWGPAWLLFVMAPVTAALYYNWWKTLGTASIAAGTMLYMYWRHGMEGAPFWGMAATHAVFIIIFSLFIHSLEQTALRLRDMSAR